MVRRAPGAGGELLERIQAELAPEVSSLDAVPFLEMQTVTDEIFAAGKRTYIKAGFAPELSDGLIEELCRRGAEVGSPFSQIEVLALGGAIAPGRAGGHGVPPARRGRGCSTSPRRGRTRPTTREIDWVREASPRSSPTSPTAST